MPIAMRDVFALTKPRLSLLVIITCGGGMFLAPGHIDPLRAFLTLITTSMIVGAAQALNSYMERDSDRLMSRTRNRPLPDGRLEPWVAIALAVGLTVIAVPLLTVMVNSLTSMLAMIAMISYVLVYTPLKQKTSLAMWIGAVPGAIPPLMGWTAVRNAIELPGLALFAIMFCWQIPHFIAIAIYRKDDYERAGHKVLPLVASRFATKVHAAIWAALLVPCTLVLLPLHVAGVAYFVVAAILGVGFLGATLAGFVRRDDDRPWARVALIASLLSSTVLFVALSVGAT